MAAGPVAVQGVELDHLAAGRPQQGVIDDVDQRVVLLAQRQAQPFAQRLLDRQMLVVVAAIPVKALEGLLQGVGTEGAVVAVRQDLVADVEPVFAKRLAIQPAGQLGHKLADAGIAEVRRFL
ncbi:hypothetical protein D3C72_1358680 [compost metagenome]